jgi:GAF domain-containing protein
MKQAPLPANELDRLDYLRRLKILDTAPERELDDVTALAAAICQTPIARISLLDANRQWFKSKLGCDASGSSRNVAFCAHVVLNNTVMVVEDARKDARFHDNPFVVGEPFIRFYAGAPLLTPEGYGLGALCVMDRRPRQLTPLQSDALKTLARQVEYNLRLKRLIADVSDKVRELQSTRESLADLELFARGAVESLSTQIALLEDADNGRRPERPWQMTARDNPALSKWLEEVAA